MKRVGFMFLSAFVFVGTGCAPALQEESSLTFTYPDQQEEIVMPTWEFPGVLPIEQIADKQIRMTTNKGDIVFELFPDTAPGTVSNFIYLTTEGYYDGLTFHRREEGFVIQGGDPNGDGTGGPGYTIQEETSDSYTYDRGIVAMAKTIAPHSTGSQFFIMLGDVTLAKEYSIFGRVLEGMDVVDEIMIGDVMTTVTVEDRVQ
ncbi:MAG: Peptidyl-prolyl cis-trans isomerase [Candidatus Uhrbacteria bacterium GW2011_GWA2_52_8d]|uniref:Peptidyl-prolyl cis-trans isomerase n=1 Tax=Candidatus Uhrbacteria bacterium GW2011_GWA2_52_8d TaxID=1618979 RepID=A0A0G1ZS65_9BACT|nr:MAG: Peptidyl-prolyl cis-trans isomerase [Candidatus Uhrbacteria bacterium GW2011_GWA2_52_8d]